MCVTTMPSGLLNFCICWQHFAHALIYPCTHARVCFHVHVIWGGWWGIRIFVQHLHYQSLVRNVA